MNEYGHINDTPHDLMCADDWGGDNPPYQEEKNKGKKHMIIARRTKNGELEAIPPTESMWYHAYISCPQSGDIRFMNKFRQRFRLPYESYLEFVEDAKEGNWFPRWMVTDTNGK